MKIEDIKIDFKELERQKKRNFEDRIAFVRWWAEYVKNHPEKAFAQQKSLIDSQMKK